MPNRKDTPFVAWEFSDEEHTIASNLPDLNYKFIQNELAITATERALLAYTPDNPDKFKFEMEYLRGKIEILSYLLNVSDDAKSEAIAQLVRMAEQQQND